MLVLRPSILVYRAVVPASGGRGWGYLYQGVDLLEYRRIRTNFISVKPQLRHIFDNFVHRVQALGQSLVNWLLCICLHLFAALGVDVILAGLHCPASVCSVILPLIVLRSMVILLISSRSLVVLFVGLHAIIISFSATLLIVAFFLVSLILALQRVGLTILVEQVIIHFIWIWRFHALADEFRRNVLHAVPVLLVALLRMYNIVFISLLTSLIIFVGSIILVHLMTPRPAHLFRLTAVFLRIICSVKTANGPRQAGTLIFGSKVGHGAVSRLEVVLAAAALVILCLLVVAGPVADGLFAKKVGVAFVVVARK